MNLDLGNTFNRIKMQSIGKACEIYGEDFPEAVEKRLNEELEIIERGDYAEVFSVNKELTRLSRLCGYETTTRGCAAASFIAFLTGITKVNPLPPHYYCTEKHYADFDSDYVKKYASKTGADLEDRKCPVCGKPLKKDGYNLPYETLFGIHGDKWPHIELNFAPEVRPVIIDYIKNSPHWTAVRCGVHGKAHPTAYMLLPKKAQVKDITSRTFGEYGELVTKEDYRSLEDEFLTVWLNENTSLEFLHRLQEVTRIKPEEIPITSSEVIALFCGKKENYDDMTLSGIPEFNRDYYEKFISLLKPESFSDLVKIAGLTHSSGAWNKEIERLVKDGTVDIESIPGNREDVFQYLQAMGVDKETSFEIMEWVRKGRARRNGLKENMTVAMKERGVPDWYVDNLCRIAYMFPRTHCTEYTLIAMLIAWYKVHYPDVFYNAYLDMYATDDDAVIINEGPAAITKTLEFIEETGFMNSHRNCLNVAREKCFFDMNDLADMLKPGELVEFSVSSDEVIRKDFLVLVRRLISKSNTMVAYFSLDESCEQIAYRMIKAEDSSGEIPEVKLGEKILWDKCEEAGWQRIDSHSVLLKGKMIINDTPGITVDEFKNLCREYIDNYGIKAAVIDYLQLMERGTALPESTIDSMRSVAEDLNIAVLLPQIKSTLRKNS